VVKFTSKVDLHEDFGAVWDGRKIDVHDINSRACLSIDKIEEGAKVFVEYAITLYSARKARPGGEGFAPGTTLQLLSIGLLKEHQSRSIIDNLKAQRIFKYANERDG
jgi:hypothetical protein